MKEVTHLTLKGSSRNKIYLDHRFELKSNLKAIAELTRPKISAEL